MFADKTPILSIVCPEKNGDILRHVYEMELTPENLYTFWERAKRYPILFAQDVAQDFGKFCAMFLRYDINNKYISNGLFYVVDDFNGVFYMTDITAPIDATVHYTFFDGRMKGRIPLVRAMLKYTFDTFGFNRLSASLPYYVKPASFALVMQAGFIQEGRRRKSKLFKNEYYDEALFGILASEVNLWEQRLVPLVVAPQLA